MEEVSHTRLFIWLFLSATTNLTIAAFTLVLYFAFIFSFHLVPLHICGFGFFFLFVVFGTFPSVVLLLRTLTGSFIPFPNTNKDVTFSKVDKIPQYLRFFYCLLCFVFMSFCLHQFFHCMVFRPFSKYFPLFFTPVSEVEKVCVGPAPPGPAQTGQADDFLLFLPAFLSARSQILR